MIDSKSIFVGSLVCFSFFCPETLSASTAYGSNGSVGCSGCTVGASTNSYGTDVGDDGTGSCSANVSYICFQGNGYFYANSSISADLDYSFNVGGTNVITFVQNNSSSTLEFGPAITLADPSLAGISVTSAQGCVCSNYPQLWLSNPNNNFGGAGMLIGYDYFNGDGTSVEVIINTTAGESTLNNAGLLEFNSGIISAPYGGTLIAPLGIYNVSEACTCGGNIQISGGTSSSSPLFFSSAVNSLNSPYTSTGPYALYLYNYITIPSTVTTISGDGGTGNIILTGTLSIYGNVLGTNYLSPSGGILQFLDSFSFTDSLSFYLGPGSVDMHGNDVTLAGSVYGSGTMTVNDSIGTGTLTITSSFPGTSLVNVQAGTLIVPSGWSTSTNPVALALSGGTLRMENVTIFSNGSIVLDSTGIIDAYANDSSDVTTIAAPVSGTGAVTFQNSGTDFGSIVLSDATYTGTTTAGTGSGESFQLEINAGSFSSTSLVINSEAIVNVTPGSTTATFSPASISGSGGTLHILASPAETVLIQASVTGSLNLQTNSGNTVELNSNVSFATVNSDSIIDLVTSGTYLTINGTSSSSIAGVISGVGGLNVESSGVFFGSSTSSFPINTFTGGITLGTNGSTVGTLVIYSEESLGSNVITGNGGKLQNSGSAATVANDWIFNGGTITTVQGSLTLTGAVTTAGTGTAGVDLVSSAVLDLSSLDIISGTNFWIDGTTATIASLSGTGGLVLGYSGGVGAISTLTLYSGSSISFAGSITDYDDTTAKGALVIEADVTLSGSNTFSGGLTLSSSTLTVSGSSNLGDGKITFDGGALENSGGSSAITIDNTVVFTGEENPDFINAFTLTGSLTTSGTGTSEILFSGSGALTLTPSSLNLVTGTILETNGNDITIGTFGTGTGSLVLGSSSTTDILTVSSATSSTFSGTIENTTAGGSGQVVIEAPVTFKGTNTFSGGLILSPSVTSGTSSLTITGSGAVGMGTITGNGGGITTATTLTLTNSFDFVESTDTTFDITGSSTTLTLSGNISTTGSEAAMITVAGTGKLVISDNTLVAGTYDIEVAGGTLTYDATGTTAVVTHHRIHDGILRGDYDSYFALADALPFGGCGGWGVIPTGGGPAVVTNITVDAGALLTGSGSVTNVVVNSGGSVASGDPSTGSGIFSIADSLLLNNDSLFIIQTTGDTVGSFDIAHNATIGSGVEVGLALKRGNYVSGSGRLFTILTSGDLTGRFAGVYIPSSFFLEASLLYDIPNQVDLIINPLRILDLAVGSNAMAVARGLDQAVAFNRTHVLFEIPLFNSDNPLFPILPEVLASIDKLRTSTEMTAALNQLQPAFLKGLTVVQENNAVKVQNTLQVRTDYLLDAASCVRFVTEDEKKCCNLHRGKPEFWAAGIGDLLAQDSNTYADSPQIGYQSKTGGVTAGFDGNVWKNFYFGTMGGFTTSYTKWYENQGTGNTNTGYFGLYVSAISDMFYGNVSLIGGFSNFSTNRKIVYTGVNKTASGKHTGKQLLSHADTGINWSPVKGLTVRPFDSFDYITQTEMSYTETGAGEWDLSVDKINAILLRNELGLELSTCLCFANMKWVIAPKASWVREVRIRGGEYTAFFAAEGPVDTSFIVTGYFPDRSLFSTGVSLTGSTCKDRLVFEIGYTGEFGGGYTDHAYGGEVRYAF